VPDLVPHVLPPDVLRGQSQPVLHAGDLVLRPWEPGDAPALVAAYADPGVQHWNGQSMTEAESRVVDTARGTGVAPAAAEAVCAWAFDVGFHRLELQHSTRNPASCRVAEKSGFALEGTKRSSLLHDDGWHDMHLHGRVRDR
jgi:RimJ/RimL family protein N-acetyltransferase